MVDEKIDRLFDEVCRILDIKAKNRYRITQEDYDKLYTLIDLIYKYAKKKNDIFINKGPYTAIFKSETIHGTRVIGNAKIVAKSFERLKYITRDILLVIGKYFISIEDYNEESIWFNLDLHNISMITGLHHILDIYNLYDIILEEIAHIKAKYEDTISTIRRVIEEIKSTI